MNIFISDLPGIFRQADSDPVKINNATIGSLFWADDILLISETAQGLLQKSLKKLEDYCLVNKIKVNVKKTKIMIFNKGGRSCKIKPFSLAYMEIEQVNHFNYLGFHITPNLNINKLLEDLRKRYQKAYFKMKHLLGEHF